MNQITGTAGTLAREKYPHRLGIADGGKNDPSEGALPTGVGAPTGKDSCQAVIYDFMDVLVCQAAITRLRHIEPELHVAQFLDLVTVPST